MSVKKKCVLILVFFFQLVSSLLMFCFLTLSVIVVFIHLLFGFVLVFLDIHYKYISSLLDVWFSCNLILFTLVYLSYCNQLTAIHVNKVSYFLFGVHFLFLFVLVMIISLLFIDNFKTTS